MRYYATIILLFIVPNPYAQKDGKTVIVPTKPKMCYTFLLFIKII